MNDSLKEHVELIREVFNYSQRFKGATFVIKIEYPILDHPVFPALVRDIALLHSMGIRIVIVPGAKARIDQVLDQYHIESENHGGIRVSTEQAIPFIKMAAFDVTNRVMTMLAGHRANAVIGNWVRARGMGVIKGMDFQHTGVVEKIDVGLVNRILGEGLIPVFPCIGWSALGKPYNINSNELASVVSEQLGAEKLFFIGVRDEDQGAYRLPESVQLSAGGRISRMDIDSAEELYSLNRERRDLFLEYISLAGRVCRKGIARVHIIDGREDGAILKEIFSNLGQGTMVHGNIYDSIRPMKSEDITDVLLLMAPFVEREILVARSETEMGESFRDFVVYDLDGSIHGCAALHDFGDGTGEIAGVAVDQAYVHLGIGQKIISYLLETARQRGLAKVFVLTTQTADWFEQQGFRTGSVGDLPEKKSKTYNRDRNSRIFIKDLG